MIYIFNWYLIPTKFRYCVEKSPSSRYDPFNPNSVSCWYWAPLLMDSMWSNTSLNCCVRVASIYSGYWSARNLITLVKLNNPRCVMSNPSLLCSSCKITWVTSLSWAGNSILDSYNVMNCVTAYSCTSFSMVNKFNSMNFFRSSAWNVISNNYRSKLATLMSNFIATNRFSFSTPPSVIICKIFAFTMSYDSMFNRANRNSFENSNLYYIIGDRSWFQDISYTYRFATSHCQVGHLPILIGVSSHQDLNLIDFVILHLLMSHADLHWGINTNLSIIITMYIPHGWLGVEVH